MLNFFFLSFFIVTLEFISTAKRGTNTNSPGNEARGGTHDSEIAMSYYDDLGPFDLHLIPRADRYNEPKIFERKR